MHIFLTGDFQVGKSVIIGKVANACADISGYRTVTRWEDDEIPGSVYIIQANDKAPVFDHTYRVMCRPVGEKAMQVFPEIFENRGCDILRDVHGLILMDEIGKVENNAPRFLARIKELLDGDVPILGVLRKEGTTEIQEYVRNHPKVTLIEVTEENRDTLAVQFTEKYGHITEG